MVVKTKCQMVVKTMSHGSKDKMSHGSKDKMSHGSKDKMSHGSKDKMSHGSKDKMSHGSLFQSSEDNRKLQCDLDKLSDWTEKWQLYFNTDKCKSLHIGRTNKRQVYQMNGNSLDQVMEEKDLGVIIDHELKFQQKQLHPSKKRIAFLG